MLIRTAHRRLVHCRPGDVIAAARRGGGVRVTHRAHLPSPCFTSTTALAGSPCCGRQNVTAHVHNALPLFTPMIFAFENATMP